MLYPLHVLLMGVILSIQLFYIFHINYNRYFFICDIFLSFLTVYGRYIINTVFAHFFVSKVTPCYNINREVFLMKNTNLMYHYQSLTNANRYQYHLSDGNALFDS